MPLSVRRCRALCAAAGALLITKVWLRVAPGQAVRWGSRMGVTGRPVIASRVPRPVETIRDLSDAVTAIGRRPPFSATCLEQSLALVVLLEVASVPAHVVVGVSRAERPLRAHAWVECGGAVVHGGAQASGCVPLLHAAPAPAPSSVASSCPG